MWRDSVSSSLSSSSDSSLLIVLCCLFGFCVGIFVVDVLAASLLISSVACFVVFGVLFVPFGRLLGSVALSWSGVLLILVVLRLRLVS